jgi:hypothetical protein
MTLDRTKMSRIHEERLAALVGGTRSPGSGNQWTAPADGRASRMLNEYGWATEGKATLGQGITLTREILAKLAEQAEGERPLIGLIWFADETFERVDHELVAMNADDFTEVMDDNARLRAELETALEAVVTAVEAAMSATVDRSSSPGSAADMVRAAQAQATALRRENERLVGLVSTLGLLAPDAAELAEIGMPSQELWPCLVIDVRSWDDPAKSGRRARAWKIGERGHVEKIVRTVTDEFGQPKKTEHPGEIRVDRGVGTHGRIFLDGQIVRRGELRSEGVLVVQSRGEDNYQAPLPPATDGVADTTA